MDRHPRIRQDDQRGSILIWVALFVLFMLAFVALGVDGAKLMATRTQLQNAADAAALAGAAVVNYDASTINQSRAVPVAQATAASNKAFIRDPQPVLNAVVTFPRTDRCQVDVSRTGATAIVTHIAQVVGIHTLDATATATAQLTKPNCVRGLRPFGVGVPSPFTYNVGQEYALMEGTSPGGWEHLDFSSISQSCTLNDCGNGGAGLRCEIINGYSCCVPLDQLIRIEPGVKSGPMKQGIDDLFSADKVTTEYPATQRNTYPTYVAAGGNGSRVIVVPLVTWTPVGCSGNNCWAKVNGFASFFLKRRYGSGQKAFYGEYINTVEPGEGVGGNGTVYTVLLVK